MSDKQMQPQRFWDWRSAALTALLVQIAALRLDITGWTPYLTVGQMLGFLGTILGLLLGYSVLRPRAVRMFGLAYGLLFIPWQLLILVEREHELYYDLDLILFRLWDSLALLFRGEPVYDPVFFVALAAVGFWVLGLSAGYQLNRRRNFLAVVLPSGVVTLVVQAYDPWSAGRVWFLAVYLFIALLLLGRLNFLQNREGWRTRGVFFTAEAEGDVARVTLGFAAAAILIAWSFPSALNSVGAAAKAWNKFTQPIRERFTDAFSALDSPYRAPSSEDFYGTELPLGDKTPTSDAPVLYFKVERAEKSPARYYWRGRTYDYYSNGEWSSALKPLQKNFDPESAPLAPFDSRARFETEITVTLNFPKQELIYAPAEVVWASRPSRLSLVPIDDSAFDLTAWSAAEKLSAGEQYRVRSFIANPSVEDLREAGEDYPEWAKARYLQIPPEIEPRLRELAESVAGNQPTPYDKAQALTAFLRAEMEYVDHLERRPPEGQDPVIWALFQYKKGFCMYSASAEVLMLRALEIPARMAVGFAQGKYNAARGRYETARADSHAWPEAYFPGVGWVEFEPTGNQSPLIRPRRPVPRADEESKAELLRDLPLSDETLPEPPTPPSRQDAKSADGLSFAQAARFLSPVLFAASLALALFLFRRFSVAERLPLYLESRFENGGKKPPKWLTRWAKWAKLTPVQRVFSTVDFHLRWLGYSQPASVTPRRRAALLAELLPAAKDDLAVLQEELETALFTPRAANLERARRAAGKIWLRAARSYWRRKPILPKGLGETHE